MTGKKFKKIQTAIHETMLKNQLSVQVFGDSGDLELMRQEMVREFLYVELTNTNPVVSYVFNTDETITIGRALNNVISIQDPTVSRQQCQLFVYESLPYVKNTSRAGVPVVVQHGLRKEYLEYGDVYPVYSGNRMIIGEMKFQIVLLQGTDYIIN